VSDIHEIYYEQCGNPMVNRRFSARRTGRRNRAEYRQFHDPNAYRIVLFGSKGVRTEPPHASLEDNTTGIWCRTLKSCASTWASRKCSVWGSMGQHISLAYAESIPVARLNSCCAEFFSARPKEIKWFYQEGAAGFFRTLEEYLKVIPENERVIW